MEVSMSDSSFMGCNPLVPVIDIKYSPLTSHTITDSVNATCSLVNCNIQGGGGYGLYLSANHGDSYLLDVSLNRIIAQTNDAYIAFSDSNFLLNINKLTSFNGEAGLMLYIIQLDSSSVTALPSSVLVITDSDIYDNIIGMEIDLYQAYTTGQSITLHSCRIYNNIQEDHEVYYGGLVINRIYPTDNTNVHIKDTVIYNNSRNVVINYDRLTFTNVSIYGTTSTGLTLNDSVIHIEGSMVIFNNTGTDGGGIALYGGSQIVLEKPTSQLSIYDNYASYRGGGIFNDYNNHYNLEQLGRTFGCAYVHNMAIT
jgi:hypothetical protein